MSLYWTRNQRETKSNESDEHLSAIPLIIDQSRVLFIMLPLISLLQTYKG